MEKDLVGQITEATGLPHDWVDKELAQLFAKAGVERGALTLDELRGVLAEYVQDVLLAAKNSHSQLGTNADGENRPDQAIKKD